MAGCGGQEGIIDSGGHRRGRYPIDGSEEVKRHLAFDVKVYVHPAHLVENEVSDDIRPLDLCSPITPKTADKTAEES